VLPYAVRAEFVRARFQDVEIILWFLIVTNGAEFAQQAFFYFMFFFLVIAQQ
jgi:hypothetical protein